MTSGNLKLRSGKDKRRRKQGSSHSDSVQDSSDSNDLQFAVFSTVQITVTYYIDIRILHPLGQCHSGYDYDWPYQLGLRCQGSNHVLKAVQCVGRNRLPRPYETLHPAAYPHHDRGMNCSQKSIEDEKYINTLALVSESQSTQIL